MTAKTYGQNPTTRGGPRASHLYQELVLAGEVIYNGALVAKVFHGSGYSQLVDAFKAQFKKVKAIKPKSSRDRSSETFLVGMGLKAR